MDKPAVVAAIFERLGALGNHISDWTEEATRLDRGLRSMIQALAEDQRQERLDRYARATLSGLCADPKSGGTKEDFAIAAWNMAEAMEAERERRMKP